MSDPLTVTQRSYCMSRVRGKDTKPEVLVRSALHKRGLRFRKHMKELPGRPDVVFTRAKICVFIDGDFWHGYDFETWEEKLTPFWQKKIGDTIERDRRNFSALREMGWRVVRVWTHDVRKRFDIIVEDIYAAVKHGESSAFEIRDG
jgi:DNA mismatch endonuclease, patch repair protein